MTNRNEPKTEDRMAQLVAASREQAQQRAALSALVRRVIREELNEKDRLLIRLHWYRGKSADEIAQLIGLDRSVVYRRLDRIHKTIYDKLKYAVDFRFDEPFRSEAKELLQNAGKNTFTLEALDSIGSRLARARKQRRLSLTEIHRTAGIRPERMCQLESDGRQMMMVELSALTKLLDIGVNELLFGCAAEEMAR